MITIPDGISASRRAGSASPRAELSPLRWGTVCAVTFVISLSVGRVLLGF